MKYRPIKPTTTPAPLRNQLPASCQVWFSVNFLTMAVELPAKAAKVGPDVARTVAVHAENVAHLACDPPSVGGLDLVAEREFEIDHILHCMSVVAAGTEPEPTAADGTPIRTTGGGAGVEIEALLDEGRRLEKATPEEILHWAVDRYGSKLTMATAFGPEAMFTAASWQAICQPVANQRPSGVCRTSCPCAARRWP